MENNRNEAKEFLKWFPFRTCGWEKEEEIPVAVCFHHAGGSAAYYRSWTREKQGIHFLCAELPGKGTRIGEEFQNNFDEIKPALCQALNEIVGNRAYVIFGHSMGAAIGFYVAEHMADVYGKAPAKLIVAGRQAPDTEDEKEFKSCMGDDALIRELERYQATPKEILENKELLDFFLPAIRKDYELNDSIRYRQEALHIPITAHAGKADEGADKKIMEGWKRMTTGAFSVREFEGDHFFISPESEAYFPALLEEIRRSF